MSFDTKLNADKSLQQICGLKMFECQNRKTVMIFGKLISSEHQLK